VHGGKTLCIVPVSSTRLVPAQTAMLPQGTVAQIRAISMSTLGCRPVVRCTGFERREGAQEIEMRVATEAHS